MARCVHGLRHNVFVTSPKRSNSRQINVYSVKQKPIFTKPNVHVLYNP